MQWLSTVASMDDAASRDAIVRIQNRTAWPEGTHREGYLARRIGALEDRTRMARLLIAVTDRMKAFQDIDQAVNRIRTFPDDIEEPEVQLESNQHEVMTIGLYGEADIWTLRKLAESTRDQLLSTDGITQVEIGHVPDYVTHVEIPRSRLREYGMTLG
jgi:hypothetical protein